MQQYLPFTVLKLFSDTFYNSLNAILLQQYLPFTVLKLFTTRSTNVSATTALQQYLPFTVLKQTYGLIIINLSLFNVATVLTVYGIETLYN